MANANDGAPVAVRAAGSAKGEPYLLFSTAANYNWVWNTEGSHGPGQATIFRPQPAASDWMILGDFMQQGYGRAVGSSLIVKAVNDDPDNPLLRPPRSLQEVWNDRGSNGRYDGSIWAAIPHDGYLSIGCLGQIGYDQPNVANYVCIRKDKVTAVSPVRMIWSDEESRAWVNVSCWAIPEVPNAFVAQPNYQTPYQGTAYTPQQQPG